MGGKGGGESGPGVARAKSESAAYGGGYGTGFVANRRRFEPIERFDADLMMKMLRRRFIGKTRGWDVFADDVGVVYRVRFMYDKAFPVQLKF